MQSSGSGGKRACRLQGQTPWLRLAACSRGAGHPRSQTPARCAWLLAWQATPVLGLTARRHRDSHEWPTLEPLTLTTAPAGGAAADQQSGELPG